ncbi:hypothetical protein M404DRAFT_326583 [Pisolithus tinctorius Marx 270]|uniref:Uncharacterized protein n=1 Tax=Pisolithus tinctorius Marx 270 TaxID=870435 RepID=A0A0C3PKM8_PISTI|nr:hypothetical protein M404DRAFT_326583 [Pisolithus tinctorius Marx 270]
MTRGHRRHCQLPLLDPIIFISSDSIRRPTTTDAFLSKKRASVERMRVSSIASSLPLFRITKKKSNLGFPNPPPLINPIGSRYLTSSLRLLTSVKGIHEQTDPMVCGHDYESGTAAWGSECDLGITTMQTVYEVTSIDYDCESAYATASNVNTDLYIATCINHQPLHFVALRALNGQCDGHDLVIRKISETLENCSGAAQVQYLFESHAQGHEKEGSVLKF